MTQIDLDLGQKKITDVLGRVRPVDKVYPDGSWHCPFCMSAVSPERDTCSRARGYAVQCVLPLIAHCHNPACYANPHYPIARAREELAEAERRAEDERQRKANHEWAMKRSAEERDARAARVQEIRRTASQREACTSCALHSARFGGPVKYTKHRSKCPRAGR